MRKFKIIKMTNMSPLHIGLGRDSYDVAASLLHSDTIASALASLRANGGKDGDIKDFLECLSITSAYPFSGKTYFLPKPDGKLNVEVKGVEEKVYRKSLKKVKFIAKEVWDSLISGSLVVVEESQVKGQYLLADSKSKFEVPTKSIINQRVNVPRADGEDATPFAFSWTFFMPNAGLYCIIDCEDDKFDEIKNLFIELGEQGIGSDRSVGGGHFDIEIDEIELPEVEDANSQLLLSMFIPSKEELEQIDLLSSKYQIIKRGGFISGASSEKLRHYRRNTAYMFLEGSILQSSVKPKGVVIDLTPSIAEENLHPVYRSGKAFCVNIKI